MQREEIAAWLRDAAVSCGAFGEHSKAEKFRQRAAQVEAMRCETCVNHEGGWYCIVHGTGFTCDEGCFSHERKEGK